MEAISGVRNVEILSPLPFYSRLPSKSLRNLVYVCLALLISTIGTQGAPRATILPLHYGHFGNQSIIEKNLGSMRRNLLGEARMWLYGHILTRGYYYTNLWVGTPSQRFSLIVDTGSTVTYVPCSTCTECGTHQDSPFLPTASSSYRPVACHSGECPQQQCDPEQRCKYARHYAEESSSTGFLASDVVGFGDASTISHAKVIFGCETAETGDLYTQKADGIIGLGLGQLSIVDQLVTQGASANIFSLCYGGMESGGGSMIMGELDIPDEMVFTPLDPSRLGVNAYYNLVIEEIRVNKKKLDVPSYTFEQGYGSVLDSGTTFTYLPRPAFGSFIEAVKAGLASGMKDVDGPDPKYADICWAGANDQTKLGKYFPQVDFVFAGGTVYKLDPENYLFKHRKVEGAYCLGFFLNEEGGTLLGGILVRNTLVTYDRARNQVGFMKTRCDALFDTLSSTTNGTKPSTVPEAVSDSTSPDEEQAGPAPGQSPDDTSGTDGQTPGNETDQTNSGDESATGCRDCAALIGVVISLEAPDYAGFSSLTASFAEDITRELSLEQNQFVMLGYDKRDLGVRVRFNIVPEPPATYIPSATTEHIKAALTQQEIGLRDAFAGYSVELVNVVPLGAASSYSPFWFWSFVSFFGLLLVVVVSGLIGWWYRRRQQLLAYATMGTMLDDDDDEEKAALGSGSDPTL